MLELKYINPNIVEEESTKEKSNEEIYLIEFKSDSNVVELKGDFPIKTTGFTLSRIGQNDNWDYSTYTTVYREIEGGVQFSNNGSVYVEPEPIPEPEPYVPTLEEVKESKVVEMNIAQQSIIQRGIEVTLTDGTTEHFTLTEHDQTSLMGLQAQVTQGVEHIPWHTSDQSEHCKFYSNADMALITAAAMSYVTWHVTYFRDLRIYIRSLQTKEEIETVVYGMDIPEEYQSEPLKAMIAAQTEETDETAT